MNITFWVLMLLMLLFAITMLVMPVLKVRQTAAVAYKDSNLKINNEKINELNLDLKEGRIDRTFYKAAREDLDRELLIDIPAENKETAAEHYTGTAKRHPAFALMITIFISMLALLLYLELGMHVASEDDFTANQTLAPVPASQKSGQPSVEDMTRKLDARMAKDGGSVQEWTMLARAHKYMGNHSQAANAFAVALESDVNNAQLMLEQAEMLALMNDRKFNTEARALILKAYELEPDNPNTLWFTGVAEFQAANYHQAIERLHRLLPMANSDEGVVKSIIAIVAKSRDALINSGEKMPELAEILGNEVMMAEAKVAGIEAKKEKPAAVATRLQIRITVSDAAKQKFNAQDTVFVYAKAKQGPRMPLAAQRLTLADLPTTIMLDDSMAMVADMNLSAFAQLQVSARLSKSGTAIAQSGDYIGQQDVDRSATEAVEIAVTINIETLIP